MKFKDEFFSKQDRYSLGTEESTGKKYLSIPVYNSRIDYEEYYEVDPQEFEVLLKNPEQAKIFAEKCRKREKDETLILRSGSERGSP